MKTTLSIASILLTLALAACGETDSATTANDDASGTDKHWVSAWGSTFETENSFALPPQETTVRNIARITTGGSAVRLRFFNLDPELPVTIGAAAVGIREVGAKASLKPGSNRRVTFDGGATEVVIPPNTPSYYSDPITIEVQNQDDIAVSLYIVGDNNPHQFGTAWNESYKLPNQSGDNVLNETGNNFRLIDDKPRQFPAGTPLHCNGCRTYLLRDVEVLSDEATGAMVFLGSSSFHGANTSQDQFKRISDLISVRMRNEIPFGQQQTIVNRAMSGDTLEAAYRDRVQRDVWSTQGLQSVVVWVTNDLGERSAEQIIENYRQLISDAHSRGVSVICPTWLPGILNLTANIDGEREALNRWIRESGECDAIADYAAVVEAPGGLTFLPQYNSGDFVHSNDAGHAAWADVTPLSDWVWAVPALPQSNY